MESNIKLVAWLYIVLSVLCLVAAFIVVAIFAVIGLLTYDKQGFIVFTLLSALCGFFAVIFCVPGILAGWGLFKYKQWARILALVLGVMSLPNFPLGTALGAFTIYTLLDERSMVVFKS